MVGNNARFGMELFKKFPNSLPDAAALVDIFRGMRFRFENGTQFTVVKTLMVRCLPQARGWDTICSIRYTGIMKRDWGQKEKAYMGVIEQVQIERCTDRYRFKDGVLVKYPVMPTDVDIQDFLTHNDQPVREYGLFWYNKKQQEAQCVKKQPLHCSREV